MKDMTEYIADCLKEWDEPAAHNRIIYSIQKVAVPNTLVFEFARYLKARNLPHIKVTTVTDDALKADPDQWENRP